MRQACQLIFGAFLIVVAVSCGTQKKTVHRQNQSASYNPSAPAVHPEYTVFINTDTSTQIFGKVYLDEFLFNQANPDGLFRAVLKLNFRLTDITDTAKKTVTDTLSVTRNLEKMQGRTYAVIGTQLHVTPGRLYSLRIITTDVMKNYSSVSFLTIDNRNQYTAQNFKVVSGITGSPLFRNYIGPDEAVRIYLNTKIHPQKLYIRYQQNDFSLPPPPFSSQTDPVYSFKADSTWVFDYVPGQRFAFPHTGTYLIQTDTLQEGGMALSNFGADFPQIKHVQLMIAPMQYLTTTTEYRDIISSGFPKIAVDNFWLKLAGNADMGRELIRIFYARLFYSNIFFTSYKPGWQTDRGMIYSIFGPPSYIRMEATGETWQYYVKQNASNLTLVFLKTYSPYSDNHYVLQRNDAFTPFWRDAVNSWRSGKIYSLEQ